MVSPGRGGLAIEGRGARSPDPLLEKNGHALSRLLADHLADLGLDRQLVPAVPEGHERTLERVAVDGAADLHQTSRAEVLDRLGPDEIGVSALVRTLLQAGGELLVQRCVHDGPLPTTIRLLPSGSRRENIGGATSSLCMTSGSVSTPRPPRSACAASASGVSRRMPAGTPAGTSAMVVAAPGGATSIQRAGPKGRSRRFSKPS